MSFPRYERYKDSGVEWLGEVPQGWNVKKLKYIGNAIIGLTYSPNDIVDENDGTLILRSSNIQNGRITLDDNVYVKAEIPHKLLTRTGDILICSRNGSRALIGKNGIIDDSTAGLSFGAFTTVFRTKFSAFVYYILKSSLFSYQSGRFLTATINQLTTETLNSFEIPLPPIQEQTTIAAFLDCETTKIDNLINEQKKLIELLKEKRQAVISTAVTKGLNPHAPMKDSGVEWLGEVPMGWEIKRLKDSESVIVDCKNRTPEEYPDGDYFVVRTTCIKNGTFNQDGGFFTDETHFLEWTQKGKPKNGDVLFTREAPMGEACLAPDNLEFCLGQRMMFIRPNNAKLLPEYLLYSIYSPLIRENINSKSKGSTVSHLRVGEIGELPLLLPSINEQTTIVTFLNQETAKIDNLIQQAQKATTLLQERRTALISAAVTGKIDVRGFVTTNTTANCVGK